MKLRAGQTLSSPVDTTTVIVVRTPAAEVELTCAGVLLYDAKSGVPAPTGDPDPSQLGGSLLGKRYADDGLGLELLCTKGGKGTLAVNGIPIPLRDAKPLPASD
ncbi:hypothetical protein [Cryptosporangium aurantiacum]|uniref:Uncharacterized protein n=1 Tax=Cryptosporangium aurantiacum TaxID=134849 RepID=A0A1M7R4L3_9ACTN|nr:hypothetical protein [Cryptosporangium aurantiacum]SHN39979.1 hypothetical protein SAMN05443668_106400 [Cryptosporangium aurantiacum]